MKANDSRNMALMSKYFVASAALVLLLTTAALGQAGTGNWYLLSSERGVEQGQVSELKDKRRVYVSIIMVGQSPIDYRYQYNKLQQQIDHDIAQSGVLEVVKNPEEADLALDIRIRSYAAQPVGGKQPAEESSDVDFWVMTRGAKQSDGTYARRVIIKSRKTDAGDGTSIVRLQVASLVNELKRARDGK